MCNQSVDKADKQTDRKTHPDTHTLSLTKSIAEGCVQNEPEAVAREGTK